MNLFLGPPVTVCLECDETLHIHNPPVRVLCYTNTGPLPAQKITLRCKNCNITYRYHQYGNSTKGYRFYHDRRSFVQASNVCYVERCVCEQFTAAGYVLFDASFVIAFSQHIIHTFFYMYKKYVK